MGRQNSNGDSPTNGAANHQTEIVDPNNQWTCSSFVRRLNAVLTDGVHKLLYKHGFIVGHYPWLFLILPLIMTGLFGIGIVKFKADQEIRHLFTPQGAQSHDEFDKVQLYFNDEGGLYDLMLYFQARDGGSVLRNGYPERVLKLVQYIANNYTIVDESTNRTLSFLHDLQINHRNEYEMMLSVLEMIKLSTSNKTKNLLHPLTFPVTKSIKGPIYLGSMLSGITTHPITQVITGVQTIRLSFKSACGNAKHFELLKKWAYNFLTPDSIIIDPHIKFSPWSDYLMTKELLHVSNILAPYVVLSFCVLMFFAVCASVTDSVITSKPWEALAGVFSVSLAVTSSFGILFLMGFSFVGTLAVMPVLVLALGLDVTFIVLRNWQSTNPELDMPSRLAETWAESGTSVIITSLTNIMSTSIGMITDTPAIYIFCLSTTIAVFFLFLYQITFFAAVIALGGNRESKNLNAFLCCIKAKPNINSSTARKQPLEPRRSLEYPSRSPSTISTPSLANAISSGMFSVSGSPGANNLHGQHHHVSRGQIIAARILNDDWWYKISKKLASLLCNSLCRFIVLIGLAIYWTTSVWGCLHLELGLSPEKLFLPESVILASVEADRANLLLNVFVQKPPNFTIEAETHSFYNMVKELESLSECLGPDSTSLWLRDYEKHLEFLTDVGGSHEAEFYKHLDSFRQLSNSARWLPYFVIEPANRTVDEEDDKLIKFFFSVAYKRARTFSERVRYTREFRSIVDKYADQFNCSIYCDDNNNFITDQLEAIPGNTLQDVIITGLCMAIICLLFIPNFFNTICAMATIFSINIGVFGYLVYWNVALDPVSMTSLLMSIGYSVDFTSHISFHYYISSGLTQHEKLVSALSTIGLPMIETGFSTILSVGCLCLIQSYLVWVYFKTTFLVVILGLFHGLIVLPTFLAWLPTDVWEWIYSNNDLNSGNTAKASKSGMNSSGRRQHQRNSVNSDPDIVRIAMRDRN